MQKQTKTPPTKPKKKTQTVKKKDNQSFSLKRLIMGEEKPDLTELEAGSTTALDILSSNTINLDNKVHPAAPLPLPDRRLAQRYHPQLPLRRKRRKGGFGARRNIEGRIFLIFSQGDIDVLGLIRWHKKSGALIMSKKGVQMLQTLFHLLF